MDNYDEDCTQSSLCQFFFSDKEIRALVTRYVQHRVLLDQRHCTAEIEKKKKELWEEIRDEVLAVASATGRANRTLGIDQLKKKISDMKKNARDWLQSLKNPKPDARKSRRKLWYYDLILDTLIGKEVHPMTMLDSMIDKDVMIDETEETSTSGCSVGSIKTEPNIFLDPEDTPTEDILEENTTVGKSSLQNRTHHIHRNNKESDSYDNLLQLEIKKTRFKIKEMVRNRKTRTTILREKLALQRDRLQFRREEIQLKREELQLKRDELQLKREEVALELDLCSLRKARLELKQMEQASSVCPVVSSDLRQ